MRIVHVIQLLHTRAGGTLAVAAALSRALRSHGANVRVIAARHDHEPAALHDLERAGVDVVMLDSLTKLTMDRAIGDAEVIHIHGMWDRTSRLAAAVARSRQIPFILTPHGMLTRWAMAQKTLKKRLFLAVFGRRLLAGAAGVHVCSEFERRESERLRSHAAKVFVERNGVELKEFESLPARGEFRTREQIGDRPIILFLGRCHPGKGLEYLIPAMEAVRTPAALLVIVGNDPNHYGQRLADASGVAKDRIRFCGHLRGRERLVPLVDADVFVQPSDHENFGVAVIEAAAAGCPAIVSDQIGVADELLAADVGRVASREPAALATAIDAVLADQMLRDRCRVMGQDWARHRFDYHQIAEEWLKRYASVLMP